MPDTANERAAPEDTPDGLNRVFCQCVAVMNSLCAFRRNRLQIQRKNFEGTVSKFPTNRREPGVQCRRALDPPLPFLDSRDVRGGDLRTLVDIPLSPMVLGTSRLAAGFPREQVGEILLQV